MDAITSVAMPVPAVTFRIQLLWHQRTHQDLGARFFRSLVVAAVKSKEFPPLRRTLR